MLMRRLATLALLVICATPAALAEPDPTQLRVGQLAELVFAPGSAELARASMARQVATSRALDPLAAAVAWAQEHPGGLIVIDGHADPSSALLRSTRLSLQRAKAVRARLVAIGVAPDQIVIAAFGNDGSRRDGSVIVWGTARAAR
jgi:outer membrane protein OmpA-like peptidoglycan-associated protein